MPHLTRAEQSNLTESVYESLFGDLIYYRWKVLKDTMGFEKERDFVCWLIDTAEAAECEASSWNTNVQKEVDEVPIETMTIRVRNEKDGSTQVMEKKFIDTKCTKVAVPPVVRDDAGVFACKYCRKVSFTKEKCLRHIEEIHKRKCARASSSPKSHKQQPRDTATQRLPVTKYHCSHCSQSFQQFAFLQTHIDTKHRRPQKRRFQCTLCRKKFTYKTSAGKHLVECRSMVSASGGEIVECLDSDDNTQATTENLYLQEKGGILRRSNSINTAGEYTCGEASISDFNIHTSPDVDDDNIQISNISLASIADAGCDE